MKSLSDNTAYLEDTNKTIITNTEKSRGGSGIKEWFLLNLGYFFLILFYLYRPNQFTSASCHRVVLAHPRQAIHKETGCSSFENFKSASKINRKTRRACWEPSPTELQPHRTNTQNWNRRWGNDWQEIKAYKSRGWLR